ncbi:unnamed protein product [Trichobilharzia regenti]|nr:unnamed protein product [Trichobilharzia regenti]
MINDKDCEIVSETTKKGRETTLKKSKSTKIRKFNKLLEEKNSTINEEVDNNISSSIDRTNCVINLSSRELSCSEIKLLEEGLHFNIKVSELKPEDVNPNIEIALSLRNKATAENLRAQCTLTLKKKKTQSNLTKSERLALINLIRDKNIIIAKVDKRNSAVVLDKSGYVKKATKDIETGRYEEIKKPVDTIMNKVRKSTAELKPRMKLSLDESKWLNLIFRTNNASRIYCTVKIHKPDYPIRSMVDFRYTPTYELSKHLSLIPCPIRNRSNSRLTNSGICFNAGGISTGRSRLPVGEKSSDTDEVFL